MCQPLDYGVFGSAKSVFSSLVEDWRDTHDNRELKLTDFVKILFEVQKQVFTPQTIKNAFKGTGVYPLNEDNIHVERCIAHDSPTLHSATIHPDIDDENARDCFNNDSPTPSTTFNELTLSEISPSHLTTSSADEKLIQIEKQVGNLENDFHSDQGKLFMCAIIKQQVQFLKSSSVSAASPPMAPSPSFSTLSVADV